MPGISLKKPPLFPEEKLCTGEDTPWWIGFATDSAHLQELLLYFFLLSVTWDAKPGLALGTVEISAHRVRSTCDAHCTDAPMTSWRLLGHAGRKASYVP